MNHIITFIVFFLFVSCQGRPQWQCGSNGALKSTYYDKRCDKIWSTMFDKVKQDGVCDPMPGFTEREKKELSTTFGSYDYYLTPEKCEAYWQKVWANSVAFNKIKHSEVCGLKPNFIDDRKERIMIFDPNYKYYLTPEKCEAHWAEVRKQCKNLPYDPDSIVQTSGSATYHKGKKVSQDGKPVCP